MDIFKDLIKETDEFIKGKEITKSPKISDVKSFHIPIKNATKSLALPK